MTDYSLEDLAYDYVPDPYYTRNFNQALDIIETSLNGLVESLKNHNNYLKQYLKEFSGLFSCSFK